MKPEVEEAVEWVGEIIEKIDESDPPEKALGFFTSVRSKLASMSAWMEANDCVTERMTTAFENMEAGIDKWLEEDD